MAATVWLFLLMCMATHVASQLSFCGRTLKCPPDQCCSTDGICDETIEACGPGCEPDYGICAGQRNTGRCGPVFGPCDNASMPCCRNDNYCGATSAHCSAATCQGTYSLFSSCRCGRAFGGAQCGAFQCCSAGGFCGTGPSFCGVGCQAGACWRPAQPSPLLFRPAQPNPLLPRPAQPSPLVSRPAQPSPVPPSTNPLLPPVVSRCGPTAGGARCPTGQCCGASGVCGVGNGECRIGCQSAFGICVGGMHNRCGPVFGNCSNPRMACCSSRNWCSNTAFACSAATCRARYSLGARCRCGRFFGNATCAPRNCCSAGGNCGTGPAFCGAGCQGGRCTPRPILPRAVVRPNVDVTPATPNPATRVAPTVTTPGGTPTLRVVRATPTATRQAPSTVPVIAASNATARRIQGAKSQRSPTL